MPKLTLRQKEAAARKKNRIRDLSQQGLTQKSIATQVRCSQQYVSSVLREATKENAK